MYFQLTLGFGFGWYEEPYEIIPLRPTDFNLGFSFPLDLDFCIAGCIGGRYTGKRNKFGERVCDVCATGQQTLPFLMNAILDYRESS